MTSDRVAELDRLVILTRVMHLTINQSLAYVAERRPAITRRYYLERLATIARNTTNRMYAIAKDFSDLHMARIDTLRAVESNLWELYNSKQTIIIKTKMTTSGTDKDGKPMRATKEVPEQIEIDVPPETRAKILHEIAAIQPYISAYEEATRDIIETTDPGADPDGTSRSPPISIEVGATPDAHQDRRDGLSGNPPSPI